MLNPPRANELGDCMSPGLAIVSTMYSDFMRSWTYFSLNSRKRSNIFLNLQKYRYNDFHKIMDCYYMRE